MEISELRDEYLDRAELSLAIVSTRADFMNFCKRFQPDVEIIKWTWDGNPIVVVWDDASMYGRWLGAAFLVMLIDQGFHYKVSRTTVGNAQNCTESGKIITIYR